MQGEIGRWKVYTEKLLRNPKVKAYGGVKLATHLLLVPSGAIQIYLYITLRENRL
jgi:hypothetical protein